MTHTIGFVVNPPVRYLKLVHCSYCCVSLTSVSLELLQAWLEAANVSGYVITDEKIALLGAIQSLFEGSMYTFVFLWTPALSPNDEDIPHGFIFATFMLASMLGSSFASRLLARSAKVESYMQIVFTVSSASLMLPIVTSVCFNGSLFLVFLDFP